MKSRLIKNIIFVIVFIFMNIVAYDYDVVAGILMTSLTGVLVFMLWMISHFDGWKS